MGYVFKADIEIDKKNIANQIIEGYKDGMTSINKEVNKNGTITYNIVGDTKQFKSLLEDLQKKGCEIGSDIVINTTDKELQDQIDKLSKNLSMNVSVNTENIKNITSDIQKQINKQDPVKINVVGDIDKNKIQDLKKELKNIISRSTFSDDPILDFELDKNIELAEKLKSIFGELKTADSSFSIDSITEDANKNIKEIEQSLNNVNNIYKEVRKGTKEWSLNKLLNNPDGFGKSLNKLLGEYSKLDDKENLTSDEKITKLNLEAKIHSMEQIVHNTFKNFGDSIFKQVQSYISDDFESIQDKIWDNMANGRNLTNKQDFRFAIEDEFGVKNSELLKIDLEYANKYYETLKKIDDILSYSDNGEGVKKYYSNQINRNIEIAKDLENRLKKTPDEIKEQDPKWVNEQYEYISEYLSKAEEYKRKLAEINNEIYTKKEYTPKSIKEEFLNLNNISNAEEGIKKINSEMDDIVEKAEKYKDIIESTESNRDFKKDLEEHIHNASITRPDYENFSVNDYNQGKKELVEYYNRVVSLQNELDSFSTNHTEQEVKELKDELYNAELEFVAAYNVLNDYSDYRLDKSGKSGGAKQNIKDLYSQINSKYLFNNKSDISLGTEEAIEGQNKLQEELDETVNKLNGIKLYHGSNKDFDKFDSTLMSDESLFGKGAYFTFDEEDAETYGYKVSQWFANVNKVYEENAKLSEEELKQIFNEYNKQIKYIWGDNFSFDDFIDEIKNDENSLKTIAEDIIGSSEEEVLKKFNYQARIFDLIESQNGGKGIVVFDINNIEKANNLLNETPVSTEENKDVVSKESLEKTESELNSVNEELSITEAKLEESRNYAKQLEDQLASTTNQTKELADATEKVSIANEKQNNIANQKNYNQQSKTVAEELDKQLNQLEGNIISIDRAYNSKDELVQALVRVEKTIEEEGKIVQKIERLNIRYDKKGGVAYTSLMDSDNYSKFEKAQKKDDFSLSYNILKNTVSEYEKIMKRIASGNSFENDEEDARSLLNTIQLMNAELKNNPLYTQSKKYQIDKKMNGLDSTINNIELVRQAKENKQEEKNINTIVEERIDAYKSILNIDEQIAKLELNSEKNKNTIAALKEQKEIAENYYESKYNALKIEENSIAMEKALNAEAELRLETEQKINLLKSSNADTVGSNLLNQTNNMSNQMGVLLAKNWSGEFGVRLEDLSNRIEFFKDELNNINPNNVEELKARFNELKNEMISVNSIEKNLAENKAASDIQLNKLAKQIADFTERNSAMGKGFKARFDEIARGIQEAYGSGNLQQVKDFTSEILRLQTEVINAGKTGMSFGQGLINRIKSITQSAIAMAFSFYDIIRYARETVTVVTELDSALTELRKVSDASTERLAQSFEKSADTAKDLGSTITDVINVTADWSRLGYDIDNAEELARVTTLFQNVGDNMTADDASSYLISTLQGFQMAADQSEEIVDRYNEVANNFAIDTAGIGEALQRSAASFNAANTDLSKSIALITATNEVVQNPEAVGTLWKTLSARIRGAKTELEDLGEETDEYTETTSKLRDLVKSLTGFDIMEDED